MAKKSALMSIVREAKALRRKYPHRYDNKKNPWASGYMAEASAIYARKHKGKSPVGKKKAKKKTGRSKQRVSSIKLVERHEATISRARRRKAPKRAKKSTRKRKASGTVGAVRRAGSTRRRSVGKSGINTGLLLGGIAVLGLGYLLLKKNTVTTTPTPGTVPSNSNLILQGTGNQTRDQQANNILNYAVAAGLVGDAIYKLIDRLNTSSDSDVDYMYNDISTSGDISSWV